MSYEFLWEPPYLLLHPQATPRGSLGTVYNFTYMGWSIVGSPRLCLAPSLHAGFDIHLCYCAEGNIRSHVQPGISWVTGEIAFLASERKQFLPCTVEKIKMNLCE